MNQDIQDILPGEGLGKIRFGISRAQLKELIGEPDEVDEYSYSDEEEDLTESWHYDELDLSASFDEEYDWRLVTLSVSGPEYTFMGKKLIGLQRLKLVHTLTELGLEDLEFEDCSTDESPDHQLIASNEAGVNFWLDKGVLTEIQWSPLFIENGDDEDE